MEKIRQKGDSIRRNTLATRSEITKNRPKTSQTDQNMSRNRLDRSTELVNVDQRSVNGGSMLVNYQQPKVDITLLTWLKVMKFQDSTHLRSLSLVAVFCFFFFIKMSSESVLNSNWSSKLDRETKVTWSMRLLRIDQHGETWPMWLALPHKALIPT